MSRTPQTVTHAEHVVGADGVARPTGRTFDATYCADPATCGSEFQVDSASSRTVICTQCGLQGVAELDAAAGEAASHG